MFKKKPIYIITIIVATILLIADIAFYKTTSAAANAMSGMTFDTSDLPSGESMPDMSNMPSGESMPDMSNMPSGESMPDMSNMPSGESMPDMSNMPSGGNMPQMSGNTDSSSDGTTPDFSQIQTQTGKFTTIRKFCIPAAILFILLDLISIVRLIQISRKKKNVPAEAAEEETSKLSREELEALEAQQAVEASIKRRSAAKRRNIILAVVLAVCLVGLSITAKLVSQKNASSSSEVEEQVLNAEAATGSIDTVLKSYGTLAAEDSTEVTIPGNVTITGYAVSDGDSVKAGDLIANVDKTTVLSAIAELQSLMDELDEELENLSDETVAGTVEATVDGRVIAVYAEAGTSVVDTMYDHSALMLISLDGKMAVDFETEQSLTVGDSVVVTASDGTKYDGKVASALNGEVTVTITDDGPAADDTVTVTTSDGTKLADGTLYIHSCQKITGFTGTVSEVNVSAGSSVSAGDTLLTLTDTGYTANYNKLMEERETLESQMSVLMKAYMTGGIYAESDGVIGNLTEIEGDSADSASAMAYRSSNSIQASAMTYSSSAQPTVSGSASAGGGLIVVSEITGTTDETISAEDLAADEELSEFSAVSDGSQEASDESGAAGNEPAGSDDKSGQAASGDSQTPGGSGSMPSGDSGNPGGSDMPSGDTPSGDGENPGGSDMPSDDETMTTESLAAWILSLDQKTLNEFLNTLDYDTLKVLFDAVRSFEQGQSDTPSGDSGDTPSGDSDTPSGDTPSGDSGNSGESGSGMPSGDGTGTLPSGGSSGMGGDTSGGTIAGYSNADIASMLQGMTGGNASGMDFSSVLSDSAASALMSGTSSDTDDSSDDSEKTYEFEETTIGTLTPSDAMDIDITVDELDIRNVLVNTAVQVTLDALAGQSFDGIITHIDTSGSNDGGDTKYTVTVSIDRTDDMLAGMNANVDITLGTTENVLTIPEAALSEEGSHVYVYTGYDEKKDELTGKTEVTTGVSDGENVEILTGLSEGDTVYYKYAGTITYQFVNQ